MAGMISNIICNPIDAAGFAPCGCIEQTDLIELVRGCEHGLLARLCPLVKRQNVVLDLGSVKRIDAAGAAALILLHVSAREAGFSFTVVNLSRHVAEILELTGLDRYLLSHNMVQKSHSGPDVQRPAA